MEDIYSVRDFAKSRFTVCFLLAMLGLYGLYSTSIPAIRFSDELYLAFFGDMDLVKLLSLIWLMMFLSPVLAGNSHVSHVIGGAAIAASILMFFFFRETAFTINNYLLSALLLYFGLYILENSNYFEPDDDFNPIKIAACFIVSRMSIGCLMISLGVIGMVYEYPSFEDLLLITNKLDGDFVILQALIIIGSLTLFASRKLIGVLHAIPSLLIFAAIALQVPAIVLYFKDQKEFIGLYYSDLASKWVFIVAILAYGIAGYITLKSCALWDKFSAWVKSSRDADS
ncbi:MAG: hypothetical protein LBT59_06400 [Clostridiales bacterium]|jgi:hypothetical protein|nr:hypothetical protein [Clostridiales bacterium]